MSGLLQIKNLPQDLHMMSYSELQTLADEVRSLIIDTTSKTGGHLSSSLGAVELTVALHAAYDSPKDKIVWDVGHQAYAHKILTGRSGKFPTLRQKGGISGFPNRDESPYDPFTTGHASTSISSALGLVKARDLTNDSYNVVAVIGDGSLSGGLAYEGLNNLGNLKSNMVIVLNDNQMSISKNVGALANYFAKMRTSQSYVNFRDRLEKMIERIPKIGVSLVKRAENMKNRVKHFLVDLKVGVILEELGVRYIGPIDGHNIPLMIGALHYAKEVKGPIVLHVLTKKGKGYAPSESDPTKFHGVAPFKIETGEVAASASGYRSYTAVFGSTLIELARRSKKIVAITAAMLDGTGLEDFAGLFPERFFDVGIAEEHAVTFAGGLARGGMLPVVAIYSTFLQRAYDQIMHDVALQGNKVIFAIDRAGIVGEDGATHNGIFDIAYCLTVPQLIVMAPKDVNELSNMMISSLTYSGPLAIRYPRGQSDGAEVDAGFNNIELGKAEIVHGSKGAKTAVFAYGSMVIPSIEAAKIAEKKGKSCIVVNARFAAPLDDKMILELADAAENIVTVEEGVVDGGFGSAVLELLNSKGIKKTVKILGLPDKFIEHGKRTEILEQYGLSPDKLAVFL